jgi:hypothetical protein
MIVAATTHQIDKTEAAGDSAGKFFAVVAGVRCELRRSRRNDRVFRIGWLSLAAPGAVAIPRAFRQGLKDGHVEGRNIVIECA